MLLKSWTTCNFLWGSREQALATCSLSWHDYVLHSQTYLQLVCGQYKQFSFCNVKLLMKKVLITSKQRKFARGAKLQQLHNGPRGVKPSSLIEAIAWKSALQISLLQRERKLCQSGVHRRKCFSWSKARGSHPEQIFSTIHQMNPLALVWTQRQKIIKLHSGNLKKKPKQLKISQNTPKKAPIPVF